MENIKICIIEELTGLALRLKNEKENSEYRYTISESVEKIVKKVNGAYFFLKKREHHEQYDVEAMFDLQSGEIYPLWMSPSGRVHLSKNVKSQQYVMQKYMKILFEKLIDAGGV